MLFLLVIVLVLTLMLWSIKKPPNFPPGPRWLPIVGSLPLLKKLSNNLGGQHLALLELSKRYNTNVLGLKVGNTLAVNVFGFSLARVVLTSEVYEGRPNNFFSRLRSLGTDKGLSFTEGRHWEVQRRFVVRHLRDLGYGKTVMDEKIKEEIQDILRNISSNDEGIQIETLISHSVFGVLWSLTAGARIPRTDSRFSELLDIIKKRTLALDFSGGILSQAAWLRFIAPEKTGYNLIKKLNKELKRFFAKAIDDHYKNWYEDRNDDLIYAFITEMKKSNGNSTTFSHDQLLMICVDLLMGGSHTTTYVLSFAFLLMLLRPDIQAKVQLALDEAFGENETISFSAKHRVPYVEAVLLELERYYNIIPIIGPRRAVRDTVLEGYNIPKNTVVSVHAYALCMDSKIWDDPEVFRPERFLGDQGDLSKKYVIQFGLGRRRCLGEPLARSCIFIFFTEILRKFTIAPVPGQPLPSAKPLYNFFLRPQKYLARFIKRTVKS